MLYPRTNPPLVSIITIVFNGKDSIERTINSVLGQEYANIEYIIIDGGSTDGTIDIIRKYEERIAYWKSERDNGISDAFNKGISAANGSIIGFVNSDDWYNPDTISKIVPHFGNHSIVYGNVQFWSAGRKSHRSYSDHNKLRQGMTLAHPAVFVKKEIYEKLGMFNMDFKIAMDYEFIAKAYFNNVSFYNVNSVIVNMALGGLSDRKWVQAFIEERRVKELYQGKLLSYYFFLKQFISFSVRRFLTNFLKTNK
jgi:glycosyltransferase involved in cell wall biosynthesis